MPYFIKLFSPCTYIHSFSNFAGNRFLQLKIRLLKIGFLLLGMAWLLAGCAVKKYVKENEQLANKYTLDIQDKPEEIQQSELKAFIRPRPNKKILGVRFKLSTYYKLQRKQSKFNKWLYKSFGEEPVFYDEEEVDRMVIKMEKYLNNIGFFHSKVNYSLKEGTKQVDIHFEVIPTEPYRIKRLTYIIPDPDLKNFFYKEISETLIKEGDIYNAYTFDNERDRITRIFRDNGYFYFNRNYIQFIVDSAFNDHEMTVDLVVNNIREQAPGLPGKYIEQKHPRFLIKDVMVTPDWDALNPQVFDTIVHRIKFWDDTVRYKYNYLLDQKNRLKPKAFNSSIRIKPGKPFSVTAQQKTYSQLFNFRIIRSAKISYDTTGAGHTDDGKFRYMNADIQMQTGKVNSVQAELEGTNSSGDLGVRGNLVYSNRNIFKMGDVFSLRLRGGFEAQSVVSSEGGSTGDFFNTFEAGINGNFFFPRFLFLVRLRKFNQLYHPVTNLNFGFNYQVRPNYSRNIINFDIGYNWNQTKQIKHILTPINLNYVKVDPTPEFDSIIQNEPNQRLREQYSDHMIFGLNYSFVFNNQNLKYLEHFNYFRVNFETSGNLLYGLNSLFNSPKNSDGYYQFLGVRYAQYVRINTDFRHYYYFANKTSGLVFRVLLGLAYPYQNSNEIPYEKGFYGGGANDMRGWQFRALGPGGFAGFPDTASITYERVGDIQIEGNVEYRFPIYRWFKGSIFADIGNVWQYKENETFPNGDFEWNKFYREFAVDVGIGFRFDLTFFIFRLDVATPIVDPKYAEGERFRPNFPTWGQLVWNFGIGYPF